LPTASKHPKRRKRVALCGLLLLFIALIQSGAALRLEIGAVLLYRVVGSPISKRVTQCRYDPSCSLYALQSLREHGFWVGNGRIAQRLGMCSPIGWAIDRVRGTDPKAAPDADVGTDIARDDG